MQNVGYKTFYGSYLPSVTSRWIQFANKKFQCYKRADPYNSVAINTKILTYKDAKCRL